MGLRDALKRSAIRKILGGEMLERLQGAIDWFTVVPGRKRSIAAVAAAIGIGLSAVDQIFAKLCADAVLGGSVCNVHPDSWNVYVQMLNEFIQTYFVPGADAIALIFAGWGLAHASSRNKVQKAQAQAIADQTGKPVKSSLAHVITDAKGETVTSEDVTEPTVVKPTPEVSPKGKDA
jgi:hypothetical protein